jgi:arylsulfatase A-like enzyme
MRKDLENIVFVVADSLRYDSTMADREDAGLAYTHAHGTRFTQARSSGCWTLPATASMFTGLLPHEHGATSQTRQVQGARPLLAQRLRDAGYKTIQITANPVTTHIFGLDNGFDRVERVWKRAMRRHRPVDYLLAMLAKARVRRKLFTQTEDFIMGRMTDDIEAARSWMQSNVGLQFDEARRAMDAYNAQGQPVFLFINLMESHFPFHIADTFETTREEIVEQVRELLALFHYVNQTRLTSDHEYLDRRMLEQLRWRQRTSWSRLAPYIDDFVREMHEDTNNLVLFASDHGDNFGEQGWQYHFSNVNDAGNRVPLYVLEPDQESGRAIDERVSMRDLYGTILLNSDAETPDADELVDLTRAPERSVPVLESYWYNRDGKTLPKYRFNQFAFVDRGTKFVRRNDRWLSSEIANGVHESEFQQMPGSIDPIEEVDVDDRRRDTLRRQFREWEVFSQRVLR